jgi:hypothetical protein
MDRRGGDSYGVAKLNREGKIRVWKGLGEAIGSIDLPQVDSSQLMLHTRRRTHGAINLENAHPLQHGHILGCHNGIVSNHFDLNKKYNRDFALDSRHIFQHIAEGDNLGEIEVYGAISYIDMNKPDIINLCRLSAAGDLKVVGLGKDRDNLLGVVYASTAEPIVTALRALKLPFFEYDPIEAKRHYFIREGKLYNTLGKSGEMPFGKEPYKHWNYNRNTSSRRFSWEIPDGLKVCKSCKKARKKNAQSYSARDLCTKCWDRWYDLNFGERVTIGTEKSDPIGMNRILGLVRKPATTIMCATRCGKEGTVVATNNLHYCADCLLKKRRDEALVPTNPLLMKPGGEYGDTVEGELLEEISGRKYLIPIELEQWDLCRWCNSETKAKGKFHIDDMCAGCRARWEAMMQDLKAMSKPERCQFIQVTPCATCKVPTFGWRVDEAFTADHLKLARCARCTGRCSLCGANEPEKKFTATRDGSLIPYCKDCFKKRGEIVEMEDEDSAVAGTNH